MKRRLISILLCIVLVLTAFPAEAHAATSVDTIIITGLDVPVLGAKPDLTAETVSKTGSGTVSTYVDHVTWIGSLDDDGRFKAGVKYGVSVVVLLKEGCGRLFSTALKKGKGTVTINGKKAKVDSWSENFLQVTYSFSALKKPVVEKPDCYSTIEADAISTPKGTTLTITSTEDWRNITEDDRLNVTRLILNIKGDKGDTVKSLIRGSFYHLKELWIGPDCDTEAILYRLSILFPYGAPVSGYMNTADCYVLISAEQFPKGLNSVDSYLSTMPETVKIYSGDVIAAAKKGVESTKDWCTKHSFNQRIEAADRICRNAGCEQGNLYYYSCEICGKCEYNPKHTFPGEGPGGFSHTSACTDIYELNIINEDAFIGINAAGQRLYWSTCISCGKDRRTVDLSITQELLIEYYGKDCELTLEQYLEMLKNDFKKVEEKALAATKPGVDMFTVDNNTVTAKVSSAYYSDVSYAKLSGLTDDKLLGSDYTKNMTRQQLCSVAVKLAEKLTGKEITPASSSTYSDTKDAYVLKAKSAGFIVGISGKQFKPNLNVTRQLMASFLYNVLMYVKANSDIAYTEYNSKLSDYTDSDKLSTWAKEPMAFMNALGLVEGTSATKLSPTAKCSIQEALATAYKSMSADQIGWYIVTNMKECAGEPNAGDQATNFYFIPASTCDIQQTYVKGEIYWVKAIYGNDGHYWCAMDDPYTESTIYALKYNFTPIRNTSENRGPILSNVIIGTAKSTAKLNARASASKDADVVGIYAAGETIYITDADYSTEWCRVSFNGKKAYVMKKYIKDVEMY